MSISKIPKQPHEVPCPHETLTPEDHFRLADKILADLSDVGLQELLLPFNQARLAKARVHAMLAQCVLPDTRHITGEYVDQLLDPMFTKTCRHCKTPIEYVEGEWMHRTTGLADCWRDPQHTETATPERN
jgi:hypothetical protein